MASYYLYNYQQHARLFADEDIPDVVKDAGRLAILKNLPLVPVIISQLKDSQSNNFEQAWRLAGQSTVGNTENSIGLLQSVSYTHLTLPTKRIFIKEFLNPIIFWGSRISCCRPISYKI